MNRLYSELTEHDMLSAMSHYVEDEDVNIFEGLDTGSIKDEDEWETTEDYVPDPSEIDPDDWDRLVRK